MFKGFSPTEYRLRSLTLPQQSESIGGDHDNADNAQRDPAIDQVIHLENGRRNHDGY
jgi:hypothetical protein